MGTCLDGVEVFYWSDDDLSPKKENLFFTRSEATIIYFVYY